MHTALSVNRSRIVVIDGPIQYTQQPARSIVRQLVHEGVMLVWMQEFSSVTAPLPVDRFAEHTDLVEYEAEHDARRSRNKNRFFLQG